MIDPLLLVYIPFYSNSTTEEHIELFFWQNVMETFHDTPEKDPLFFNSLKTSLV
jgi:hypothetical protein